MSTEEAPVILILGSPADRPWGERIVGALERLGIGSETFVASAHKTPEWLLDMLKLWEGRPPHIYITVAGRSNALSGFVDAQVMAPVIACPPASESFAGLDILSSLRMPRGVAPMVVLEPENAALATAKMLGLLLPELQTRVAEAQEAERQRVLSSES